VVAEQLARKEDVMRKIPTIFERDWTGDRSRVLDRPHPDCAWVFAGEGVATRKLDGTCCLIRDGALHKRREVKKGQPAPVDFEEVSFDDETGKRVGWVPVGDGPEDRYHREALARLATLTDGTYELVGPHVQGNPEHFAEDVLVAHASIEAFAEAPRAFDALRAWLAGKDIEGLVFHHPDGRMAKVKLRDFGLVRGRVEC
jgi:hypothetical protein